MFVVVFNLDVPLKIIGVHGDMGFTQSFTEEWMGSGWSRQRRGSGVGDVHDNSGIYRNKKAWVEEGLMMVGHLQQTYYNSK